MDQDRETKLHEIIRREISHYQISNLYITHITGVLCKIHLHDDKWITGRVLFSRRAGNHAFVYTEPLLPCPWIDFSARSDHAVLFTTEQIYFQGRLARKFRGTIKGLTTMRCFNDGLYIESFPPDSSSRVVSSSQCQSFDTSQTQSLDPLTRTSLQREMSYISRIRMLITNLLNSTEVISPTPAIAQTGAFLPQPSKTINSSTEEKTQNAGNNSSNGHLNSAPTPTAPNTVYNGQPYRAPLLSPKVSRLNGSVYQPPPRPVKYTPQTSSFLPQLASRPLPSIPTTNPIPGIVNPQVPSVKPRGPPSSVHGVLPGSKRPQSASTPKRPTEHSAPVTVEKRPPVPAPAPAPLRYEVLNNPFPDWKKELIIPGWISQSEWIGKPQIQYTPPASVIPFRNRETVLAYLNQHEECKHLRNSIDLFDFREVFCLCHKPEISEVITYMECLANVAGCNRWFHPECAGWDRFELDQFEDDLICPLCTEYMERNPSVNNLVEKRLCQSYLRNKAESSNPLSMRPFQVMRLKGKGRYYVTDMGGLPEPSKRILRRSQVEQLCPIVTEQGRLEILAFNQPHRVWGISDGDISFTQVALVSVNDWMRSESSLVKPEVSPPATERTYGHLVGKLDSSLIATRSQYVDVLQPPKPPPPPLRAASLPRSLPPPTSPSLRKELFPIPWVEEGSPSLSDPRLNEDIRVATKFDVSGKRSHVFVSIRAGWKDFPSYDAPVSLTHEERVKQSTEAVVPLPQRFEKNVIQLSTDAISRGGGAAVEESSPRPPIDGVVPLCDGALVTTHLLPGRLPDLSVLYQDHCALCLESLAPNSHCSFPNTFLTNSEEGPLSKRVRTDPETAHHEADGVKYLLHSLCSELVTRPELFQAIVDTITSQGSIRIHGPSTATADSSCQLCGRTGGILFQYSHQLVDDKASIVINSAHGFCLRGLGISGLPTPLGQYQCSLCGQRKGLTFCCNDPTCHRHAHHICALQAGWNIGSVVINDCLKKSPKIVSGVRPRPPSYLCFLCHDHSFRTAGGSGSSAGVTSHSAGKKS